MSLVISNFRGIKEAEINLSKITFVCGGNFQGKSTVADAAARALTGEVLPAEVKKNSVQQIIHDDSAEGYIAYNNDKGRISIRYPSCKFETEGDAPHITHVAAGLKSPAKMTEKERAKYYSDLLGLLPTKDDLKAAVEDANIPDEHFDKLWKSVKALGWDGAHAHAKEKGAELKGQWRQTTGGEAYGIVKAESWKPQSLGDNKVSIENIQDALSGYRTEKDSAVGVAAIDEAETARLQALVNSIPEVKKSVSVAKTAKTKLEKAHSALTAKDIKPPDELQVPHECPHCKKMVTIDNGKLLKHNDVKMSDIQKANVAYDEHQKKLSEAGGKLNEAVEILFAFEQTLEGCVIAKRQLEGVGIDATDDSRTVGEIEADITLCETQLTAMNTLASANKIHEALKRNDIVVKALDANGIRRVALGNGVDEMNKLVNDITANAAWQMIEFDRDDLSIQYNGRPYVLCSKSERFRVRAALQIMSAIKDGSRLVIIDGADILTKPGRIGLVKAIHKSSISALVCMTVEDIKDAPDAKKLKGLTYWIENGVSASLHV